MEMRKARQKQQQRQKKYYDYKAQDLPPINVRDTVRIQPFHGRVRGQGTVTEKLSHRSYLIKRPNESTIQRNRSPLRLSRERPQLIENSYDSDLNFSAPEEDEECEPDSESEDNEEM